jgi:hypothetical protein
MHFHIVLATLLGDPPGLFEIGNPKGFVALSSVIAGIVDCGEFMVNGFI